MNNLFNLIKIEFINNLKINEIKDNKKSKTKYISMTILYIAVMVLLGTSIYQMLNPIADVLYQIGQIEIILYVSILMSVFATIMTSIYKIPGYLITNKEYDILLTLPISHKTILVSKMVYIIALSYMYSGFMTIPALLLYYTKTNQGILFLINALVMFIFITLIPIVISSILVFALGKTVSKFRYKEMLMSVLSIIIIVGIMVLSYTVDIDKVLAIIQNQGLLDFIKMIYIPAYFYVDALLNYNFISLMMFVLMSVIVFVVFIEVFAKGFRKINSDMQQIYSKSDYKLTKQNKKSPMKSLLEKESKRYFSSSVYVLNTIMPMVLITIMSVSALVVGREQIMVILEMPNAGDSLYVYILMISIIFVSMTCTTNSSISLEGKNLWILKSSPIEVMDIFKAKIGLNLLIAVPGMILNTILLSVAFRFSVKQTLVMIVVTTLYSISTSMIGLIVNLNYPNIDYKTEVSVIKQSSSALISLIVNILSALIPVGVYMIMKTDNVYILSSVVSLILMSLIVGMYLYLKNQGVKLFNSL